MSKYYKLDRVRELAGDDEDFIFELIKTFLEEVPQDAVALEEAVSKKEYQQTYQIAHKIKPTIDLFELDVLHDLIEVQDWGKYEKKEMDISSNLKAVLKAIKKASKKLKKEFNL